jgi:hypothetical protein
MYNTATVRRFYASVTVQKHGSDTPNVAEFGNVYKNKWPIILILGGMRPALRWALAMHNQFLSHVGLNSAGNLANLVVEQRWIRESISYDQKRQWLVHFFTFSEQVPSFFIVLYFRLKDYATTYQLNCVFKNII